MATSKLLKPTNVTISIPEFTDQPDQRVNSNCIDKEADAINTLSEQITTLQSGKLNAYRHNITGHSSITTTDISDFLTAYTNYGAVAVDFYRTDNQNIVGSMFYCRTNVNYGAGILVSYYDDGLKQVLCSGGTVTIKKVTVAT